MTWFYKLTVIEGPLPFTIWGLTVLAIVVLLIRRPTPAWLWRIVLALAIGIGSGVALVLWANATNAFGGPLPFACGFWVPAGFAATLLGIVSLWERGWWRKTIAALLVVLALLSTGLGINAAFGINRTVGSLFGISTADELAELPKPAPTDTLTGPLYQSWKPPADLPKKGSVSQLAGDKAIPSSRNFAARPALLYLPPAALTDAPPRLPLIVMMMGYPGAPDATDIAASLDALAARNNGLAPIVIVADQLGSSGQDPMCVDSSLIGGVSTYFNVDIPAYAKKNLNILSDPKYWTIMGYSNGGACAFSWATHNPGLWTNVIAISPDEYPGVEESRDSIAKIFGGDTSNFDAIKPAAGIAEHPNAFTDHLAVFTVGDKDPMFLPGVKKNKELAEKAGFTTSYFEVPGAEHVHGALPGGIPPAMELLAKHLGLAAP